MDRTSDGWVKKRVYAHRSKEDNHYQFSQIEGITEEALNVLAYFGYEITINVWINPKTGEYEVEDFTF